jgi:hypothetical protein
MPQCRAYGLGNRTHRQGRYHTLTRLPAAQDGRAKAIILDREPGPFPDRPNAQGQDITAIGFQWAARVKPGSHKLSAHCHHRSRGPDGVALCRASVMPAYLGANGIHFQCAVAAAFSW